MTSGAVKYFDVTLIDTLEQLKEQYHKLALKFHPDHGGDTATMQAVNNEYEFLFEKLKSRHTNKDGEVYDRIFPEDWEDFPKIVDAILKMKGVKMDVVGLFLWVYGDTKTFKEILKKLGFRWSRNKKMWYKSPKGYRRRGGGEYTYNEIINKYGVKSSYQGAGFEADLLPV